jgi:hypothetical protein
LILAPNSTGTLRSSDDVNPLLRGLRKRSESSNRSSRTENAARRTQRGRSRSSSDTAVFENSQNLARFGSSVRKGGKPYEGRHSAKAEKPIGSRATLRSASVAIAHSCGGQAHERKAPAVLRKHSREWRDSPRETSETLGKDKAHGSMGRVCGVKTANRATASTGDKRPEVAVQNFK